MLEGLDSIDWDRLRHAYGPAGDVPGLIRSLRFDDRVERDAVYFELYGNIYHQGSRYEASAHAVPFLVELALDPLTPDRGEVLTLITLLAIGFSQEHLPDGFPLEELRTRAAGRGAALGSRAAKREAAYELATYDAVAAAVPSLVDLTASPDPDIAAAAAFTLAWFPEQATFSTGPLASLAIDADRPPPVRANALLGLGLTGRRGDMDEDPVLGQAARDADATVRWAAAVATAMRMGRATPPTVLQELRAWARGFNREDEELQRWRVGRGELTLRMLDRIDASIADEVRTAAVRARLSGRPTSNWHNKTVGALSAAFPNGPGPAPVPFNQLRAPRKELVRQLAARWTAFFPPWDGPGMLLRSHHLPTTPWGLAWYAGPRRSPSQPRR